MFAVHVIEYNGYMRYEDVKTGNAYDPSQQYQFDFEPEPIVVDYDLATKRDNVLFKMMIDLFVLSLLFPKKDDE